MAWDSIGRGLRVNVFGTASPLYLRQLIFFNALLSKRERERERAGRTCHVHILYSVNIISY